MNAQRFLLLSALLALPLSAANAQPSQHSRTTWSSEYRSIGGQHVGGTTLVLDGDRGSYSNRYVSGHLYNIAYEFLPNGDWLASGDWRSGGVGGTFQFRSEGGNPGRFRGSYTVHGRSGSFYWNGRQTHSSGYPPLGTYPAPPSCPSDLGTFDTNASPLL